MMIFLSWLLRLIVPPVERFFIPIVVLVVACICRVWQSIRALCAAITWRRAVSLVVALAIALPANAGSLLAYWQPQATYINRLQTTLVPQRSGTVADGVPTYTRATVAEHIDFEGVHRQLPAGAARMQGARVVRNYLSATELLTDAAWNNTHCALTSGQTDPLGGTSAWRLVGTGGDWFLSQLIAGFTAGNTFVQSVWVKSNTGSSQTIRLSNSGNLTTITVTTSWQRFSVNNTFTSTTWGIARNAANADADILVWHPQAQIVTGQTNQNPGEYVSVGVLSAPYHGAGVDGVKYFDTLNGNTVASNVVTEATGAHIDSSQSACAGGVAAGVVDAYGPLGYLAEGAATQILATADIRDMTTANWTLGATMTRARTSVGADGTANSATRLTAGAVAATNIITTTITAAATSRTYSALVKRITGTGPIRLTQDNFATNTDVTASVPADGFYHLVQLNQSQLNAVMGFKLDTNGDAIDVDFNQFEAGAIATSRMAATGAARNVDFLTFPAAGNIVGTQGSAYAEIFPPAAGATNIVFGLASGAGNSYQRAAGGSMALQDGTAYRTVSGAVAAATARAAVAWGGSVAMGTINGAAVTSAAFDGDMNVSTNLAIGIDTGGTSANALNGTIRNVRIYPAANDASWARYSTSAR